MKTIELYTYGIWLRTIPDEGCSDLLCIDGLQRYRDFPGATKKVWIVFTKRERAHSFEIRGSSYPVNLIVGVRILLLRTFRLMLRKEYVNGYRYFHFEYLE